MSGFLSAIQSLPGLGQPERIAIGRDRLREAVGELDPHERRAADDAIATATQLLDVVFANSPHLTSCVIADPGFFVTLLAEGAAASVAQTIAAINDEAVFLEPPSVPARLRRAKRRLALATALADITGQWDLHRITAALSRFAAAASDTALRFATAQALRLESAPLDAALTQGLFALGMGKMGADELNYSSDIDLILLYDPTRLDPRVADGAERQGARAFFTKVSHHLVAALETRTADGYVFRTDLRLRPDPASTPPMMSVGAALAYYESVGQNWERAAMIKARPVAGDRTAAQNFLTELRPFIWRKSLDYLAIQDIHAIKRQIQAHYGGAVIEVAGQDLKRGRGGIREIEFFAQTQQLIYGGRDPALRCPATCDALRALAAAGWTDSATVAELIPAYETLRTVEHRIQMIADQQTHRLPADAEGLGALARFLGWGDAATLETRLRRVFTTVESHYARLFESGGEAAADLGALGGGGSLVFTGVEDDPGTLATLAGLGYRDPGHVSATIRGWHHGRIRATRSARARELLTQLIPRLLAALARAGAPDATFHRFDAFFSSLPAGVALLGLWQARPELLDLVAEILGGSELLAQALQRDPHLLESALADPLFLTRPDRARLAASLAVVIGEARSLEERLDGVRRWIGERRFQLGLAVLRGVYSPLDAGQELTDAVELVLATILPTVAADFARAHGTIAGGRFVVLGYGKLGGRELTLSSDLDLVLVYDTPSADTESDGAKPLWPSTYYNRLTQRLVSALTVPTASGRLFEIDLRLRPDGDKGPLAAALSGYRAYLQDSAWTWEHMAATRMRPVAGDDSLGQDCRAAAAAAFRRPVPPGKILADVADMRQRMRRDKPAKGPWDLKNRAGGMIDIEFVTQYLLLTHPQAIHPDRAGRTIEALADLDAAGALPHADAVSLIAAAQLWQNLIAVMAVVGRAEDEGAQRMLARAAGAVDFARFAEDISAAAAEVAALYDRLIDQPAALPPPIEETA